MSIVFGSGIPMGALSGEIIVPVIKEQPTVEFRRSFAVQVNTPTPFEVPSVSMGKDIPTQVSYPLFTGDLAATAIAFIKATASVLPISEKDDQYIDRLVAEKYGDAPVAKLTRKV